MPKVRKDERRWKVKLPLDNDKCPHLYYPRSDYACGLLMGHADDLCTLENCPYCSHYYVKARKDDAEATLLVLNSRQRF